MRQQTRVALYAVLDGVSDYPRLVCGRHDDGCNGEFGHLVTAGGHLFTSPPCSASWYATRSTVLAAGDGAGSDRWAIP